MPRPDALVAVVGTATEVGKTWVSAAALERLRASGLRVAARKPVQSYSPGDRTDADVLAAATGERPDEVCAEHRCYERPLAPPMAAEVLGRPVPLLAELVEELSWPDGVAVGLVEPVGGVRSPIAADGDGVDLVARLRPDLVVLVADAGLGTINAVRLSCSALAGTRVVVVLNRFDSGNDLHMRNRDWLTDIDGCTVVTSVEALVPLLTPGR